MNLTFYHRARLGVTLLALLCSARAPAQESWEDDCVYSEGMLPWVTQHGDGEVVTSVTTHPEFIRFHVDSREEPHNVWWSIVRRNVPFPDEPVSDYSNKKFWMEARVRPSHAPRRINMRLFSQRPIDSHAYLKEFDLADTTWHTLRFSPEDFVYHSGDQLSCHLALIDWGNGEFHLDVKDVRIFFTDPEGDGTTESENAMVYHPKPRPRESFAHHRTVEADGMVDLSYPKQSLAGWGQTSDEVKTELISVSHQLIPLLRWDFSDLDHREVDDWGVLSLTIHSSNLIPSPEHEFGRIRITEIIGGSESWTREEVTYETLSEGKGQWELFNEQMVIDMDVPPGKDQVLRIPLNPRVLQRLLDGTTKGLAIFPLGSVQVSFYSRADQEGARAATLYFD